MELQGSSPFPARPARGTYHEINLKAENMKVRGVSGK